MAQFIARMFTPSNSDGSGTVAPQGQPKKTAQPTMNQNTETLAKRKTQTKYAGANMTALQADTAKKTLLGQ